MTDLEYYAWITFFVVGVIALPFMFRARKKILQRIRILLNQEKAKQHVEARKAYDMEERIDPWKDTHYH